MNLIEDIKRSTTEYKLRTGKDYTGVVCITAWEARQLMQEFVKYRKFNEDTTHEMNSAVTDEEVRRAMDGTTVFGRHICVIDRVTG